MPQPPSQKRSRVLIVDDHPAVREALSLRINRQPDLEVCGEAADMAEALKLLAECPPDVAVVDISLKSGSGLDLIKRMKDRFPEVRSLVWSMHNESLYAPRALQAGALGYISKDQATVKIVDAIRRVLEGKVWLSEAMSESLLQRAVGTKQTTVPLSPINVLSDRELEVFGLIGEGFKTAEIAARMHLSVKTVETYRDRIRVKLAVANGTELARVATEWVLLEDRT